jgi:hypothetical protein
VTRLGADIGLRCLRCGRRVLLERAVLEKRLKQKLDVAGSPGLKAGASAGSAPEFAPGPSTGNDDVG